MVVIKFKNIKGSAVGGEAVHTLTIAETASHAHPAWTDAQGAHSHNWRAAEGQYISGDDFLFMESRVASNNTGYLRNGIAISTAGNHGHNVGIGATGGGGAHNNMPPYYALAYIMKL